MYDVIIIFKDNSYILLSNVSNYSWNKVEGAVIVEINGYRQFFNKKSIKCIGIGIFEELKNG